MKSSVRAAITAGAVIMVAAIALTVRTLNAGGAFTSLTPGFSGTCQALPGVRGAEDLQIDETDRLVFVSATDWRAPAGHASKQDGLYTLSLDHPESGFTKLSGAPHDFHPHGLSLFRAADGKLTLMVVNHQTSGDQAVEIFDVAVSGGAAKLSARGHIEGGELISPNDLVATGSDRFYVTNDRTSRSALGRLVETYAVLPRANVVYFDGSVLRVVAQGLLVANGINLSRDGKYVYVAQTAGRSLKTYERNPFSGALTEVNALSIPSGLDNIDIAPDGSVWLAGHPSLFETLAARSDPTKRAASQIFRITTNGEIPISAEPVYVERGNEISGASVGAVSGKHLFIGSPLDDKVLDCTMGR